MTFYMAHYIPSNIKIDYNVIQIYKNIIYQIANNPNRMEQNLIFQTEIYLNQKTLKLGYHKILIMVDEIEQNERIPVR